MSIHKTLQKLFAPKPQRCPKEPSVSQIGMQARAIHHLIAHGKIDAWTIVKLGTTDAHKMLTRLRRLGLLYPLDDPRSFTEHTNAKGGAKHRVHYWSGKLPAKWVKTPRYPARPMQFWPRSKKIMRDYFPSRSLHR